MGTTVSKPAATRHVERLDVPTVMAKADLNPIETWRTAIGRAVQRAIALAGITQKEAAALIGRDQAQLARWIAGAERPQLDALFATALRPHVIVALAELGGEGIEIETVVRLKRTA